MLRLTDVGKRYRRRPVFTGDNLTVRSGAVAAIVGSNGCGKSTLLRICAGLTRSTGGPIRMLTLGIGWAVSTLTLFVVNASRSVDPRLRLTGASTAGVIGGRLLTMTGAGVVLALGYWVLVAVDQDLRRPWLIGLLTVLAAPFGSLVARELEGALTLLSVCAVQMLADPAGLAAKLMPFWSVRELGTYIVDGTDDGYLWRALLHAAITWVVCAGGTYGLFAWRLRLPRYSEP